jgi:hypothetical protein
MFIFPILLAKVVQTNRNAKKIMIYFHFCGVAIVIAAIAATIAYIHFFVGKKPPCQRRKVKIIE